MQANNGINTGRQNFQKLNPAKAHGSCKNLSLYPDSGAEQDVIYQSLAATHTTLTLYSGHAEHFFFYSILHGTSQDVLSVAGEQHENTHQQG